MFGIYLLAACDVVNSGPIQLRAELRFQHDSVLELPFSFAQQVQLASNRVLIGKGGGSVEHRVLVLQ